MDAPVSAVFFSFLFQVDSLKCFFALLNICGSGILFAFFFQGLVWRFPASTEKCLSNSRDENTNAEHRLQEREHVFRSGRFFMLRLGFGSHQSLQFVDVNSLEILLSCLLCHRFSPAPPLMH